ncbi:signal recognition particle protein [bacterium]|nr:signal recognition particle protein [bacterium]
MFGDLQTKLESVFQKLRGQGILTESNISDSLREVRRAFLEADVNFKVAKDFIDKVSQKAIGTEIIKSIKPGQLVVKIIHDELVLLLGETSVPLYQNKNGVTIVMVVGLQGSGKTTFCGKLARNFKKDKKSVVLAGADVYRPAAKDQLKTLGKSLEIPVITDDSTDALKICQNAVEFAQKNYADYVILDTAGRLHIDEKLMQELQTIKSNVNPHEILFVVDSMTGQDAVNSAKEFQEKLDYTGIVLTKLDGDTRGGAALSIRAVTGKPIKFIGVGEKLTDLEPFYPERLASRILGMGDIISLVEKAQENYDETEAKKLEEKLRKQEFTIEDFYQQLQNIKKLGPMSQLMGMLPGVNPGMLKNTKIDDNSFKKIEAIICSMTYAEKQKPKILNGSRRKRISKGSGTTLQDINKFIKQFEQMQLMMKELGKISKKKGLLSSLAKGFPGVPKIPGL